MDRNEIEINQLADNFVRIKIDGVEIHGVNYLSYAASVDKVSDMIIKFTPGTVKYSNNKTEINGNEELNEFETL